MTTFSPSDLTVVIPTRDRWDTLGRTLDALRRQTVDGFDVVVVVDGGSECPSDLGVRTIQRGHAGPGAARNEGVAAVSTPLVLFLGDDMVPSPQLVGVHLAAHERDPAPEAGVLGHVDWHPDVDVNRLHRWLDWSATQFNYRGLEAGQDAHWARFYSCNVSLKRQFFLDAGGFDPDFVYYYEDLDCGFRLGRHGLRLRYEPDALTLHLHQYDWPRLAARFDGVALGERTMTSKHEWFTPYFRMRAENALARRRVWSLWPRLVDHIPQSVPRLRARAERRANTWYYRRLAPRYLAAYESAGELQELEEYLGGAFDRQRLWNYRHEVEQEEERAPDERAFFRTSEAYLYDLTVFAMSGTKVPYHDDLRRIVPPGSRLLDYGCGIGSDGLRLLEHGYDVEFAEFDNPSARYLRWRLARRGVTAAVHDVERDVPAGFDAVYCFDVIEHVDDPIAFLAELERHAELVMVNFLAPSADDTHLHKPLDIPRLLDYVEQRGLAHHRVYHGRSHLVAYRPANAASVRSRFERRIGPWRARLGARLSTVRS